ncbi:uncharacterized protein LOC128954585 [Oppia nitens]|uniref:uncharacterized protein LOC128954585 n=1 Tax=Oppia nitens TaxID=1686743 RepID=UPI0023DBDC0C|nr:uncharacterized protein LOC128954585 [Oppia nitens]
MVSIIFSLLVAMIFGAIFSFVGLLIVPTIRRRFFLFIGQQLISYTTNNNMSANWLPMCGHPWSRNEEEIVGLLWEMSVKLRTDDEKAVVLSAILRMCGYYRSPEAIKNYRNSN